MRERYAGWSQFLLDICKIKINVQNHFKICVSSTSEAMGFRLLHRKMLKKVCITSENIQWAFYHIRNYSRRFLSRRKMFDELSVTSVDIQWAFNPVRKCSRRFLWHRKSFSELSSCYIGKCSRRFVSRRRMFNELSITSENIQDGFFHVIICYYEGFEISLNKNRWAGVSAPKNGNTIMRKCEVPAKYKNTKLINGFCKVCNSDS